MHAVPVIPPRGYFLRAPNTTFVVIRSCLLFHDSPNVDRNCRRFTEMSASLRITEDNVTIVDKDRRRNENES